MNTEDLFLESNFLPDVLEDKELHYLLSLANEGDLIAREKVIKHNIRLVLYIVTNKFINVLFDKKELVSIGSLGLIKAVDTFDVSKNYKFSTYASRCINNEILMFFRKNSKHQHVDSFDNFFYDSDGDMAISLIDTISNNFDIENNYVNNETYLFIKNLVSNLSEREKIIISLQFGFYNNQIYTQKQIANLLNVSQSHVSRLTKKILQNISNLLEINGYIENKNNKKIMVLSKNKR